MGRQLLLHFNEFLTENTNDKLNVYDGANNNARKIGTFHGSTKPNDVTSSGNSFFLEFRSSGNINYLGFEIIATLKGEIQKSYIGVTISIFYTSFV